MNYTVCIITLSKIHMVIMMKDLMYHALWNVTSDLLCGWGNSLTEDERKCLSERWSSFFYQKHKLRDEMFEELAKWTNDYLFFKHISISGFRRDCHKNGVCEAVRIDWENELISLKLKIEEKLQHLFEHKFADSESAGWYSSISKCITSALHTYKNAVEKFFNDVNSEISERTAIYQKYAFQPNGELLDKIESESKLYGYALEFHKELQKIISEKNTNSDDTKFIIEWASSLLNLQLDEMLEFASGNFSADIIDGLAKMKQKNYETYMLDAKAYSEELAQREREYNSLVFKMRKGLQ